MTLQLIFSIGVESMLLTSLINLCSQPICLSTCVILSIAPRCGELRYSFAHNGALACLQRKYMSNIKSMLMNFTVNLSKQKQPEGYFLFTMTRHSGLQWNGMECIFFFFWKVCVCCAKGGGGGGGGG